MTYPKKIESLNKDLYLDYSDDDLSDSDILECPPFIPIVSNTTTKLHGDEDIMNLSSPPKLARNQPGSNIWIPNKDGSLTNLLGEVVRVPIPVYPSK